MVRTSVGAALMMTAVLCTGCGGGSTDSTGAEGQAAPAAAPATATGLAVTPEPRTVADIFPAGPGRDLVMNNCTSCHNVACSAIGQRTPERWDSLKEAHKERVAGADVDAIFAYLKSNFDSSKPEPKVPPQFLEGGCTPF